MFVEIYVSAQDATISRKLNNNENIVCLQISSFMFSFVRSFIIDLYSLIPLTAIAKIAGMNIMFCKSIDEKIKIIPLLYTYCCNYTRNCISKCKSSKTYNSINYKKSNGC